MSYSSSQSPLFLMVCSLFLFLHLASIINITPCLAARPAPVQYQTSPETADFIKKSCDTTLYRHLCFNSLSIYADKINESPRELATTALNVTLHATKTASEKIDKMFKSRGQDMMKPIETSAMEDCKDLLHDGVGLLKDSMNEMDNPGSKSFKFVMSDVQTWVSAALTDDGTCMDGFNDGDTESNDDDDVKKMVSEEITKVSHLTSNALALVNNYASS